MNTPSNSKPTGMLTRGPFLGVRHLRAAQDTTLSARGQTKISSAMDGIKRQATGVNCDAVDRFHSKSGALAAVDSRSPLSRDKLRGNFERTCGVSLKCWEDCARVEGCSPRN